MRCGNATTSGIRSGITNSSNCEKRVQMILFRLPTGCVLNFSESGLHYFTIQIHQYFMVSGGSCDSER